MLNAVNYRKCTKAFVAVMYLFGITLAYSSEYIVNETNINMDEFEFIASHTVGDIYDLEQYFVLHQYRYLPITPPPADFILRQPGMPDVIPFHIYNFPDVFVSKLIGVYENSVLVYPLQILEDPITRETIFLNAMNQRVHSIEPVPNYNPYAFLMESRPWLSRSDVSSQVLDYWKGLYDPARVQLKTKLVAIENIEHYLFAQSEVRKAQERTNAKRTKVVGSSGPAKLSGSGSLSNILFSSMLLNSNILMTIAYPNGFTNRLDVFTTTNLLATGWAFVQKNVSTSGTNALTWSDTNVWVKVGEPERFYAAGNADYDGDQDGLADGREIMVYLTDPNDDDTDQDGSLDGYDPQPTNPSIARVYLTIQAPAHGAVLGGYE